MAGYTLTIFGRSLIILIVISIVASATSSSLKISDSLTALGQTSQHSSLSADRYTTRKSKTASVLKRDLPSRDVDDEADAYIEYKRNYFLNELKFMPQANAQLQYDSPMGQKAIKDFRGYHAAVVAAHLDRTDGGPSTVRMAPYLKKFETELNQLTGGKAPAPDPIGKIARDARTLSREKKIQFVHVEPVIPEVAVGLIDGIKLP